MYCELTMSGRRVLGEVQPVLLALQLDLSVDSGPGGLLAPGSYAGSACCEEIQLGAPFLCAKTKP